MTVKKIQNIILKISLIFIIGTGISILIWSIFSSALYLDLNVAYNPGVFKDSYIEFWRWFFKIFSLVGYYIAYLIVKNNI